MVDEARQLQDIEKPMTSTSETLEGEGMEEVSNGGSDSIETIFEAPVESVTPEVVGSEQSDSDVAASVGEVSGQEAQPDNQTEPASQQHVKDLQREIEVLKSQVEDRTGQYMRIAADFDNFRKRTQKEKEELEQQIRCSTIVKLLPVVDNFERARSQIAPQTDPEMKIHKSYQGVYKDLVERLKAMGVSAMRAEGQQFDPTLHEAMMQQPTDQYPEGTVMEEFERGYLMGDRVLRHARVKVAAAPDPVIPSNEDHQGEN